MRSESATLGGMALCGPIILPYTQRDKPIGFQLMSDLHIGARHVDYKMIRKELKHAGDHNHRILLNGDVFDGIVSSDKKRYSPSTIHPKIGSRSDVINSAVDWAYELLAPYAHLIDMVGVGNHEQSITKHCGTDMTRMLVDRLQVDAPDDHVVHYGTWGGFVDYRLRGEWRGTKESFRFQIFYHHGAGGSAPVTKGLIDFNRAFWPDADIIWFGHKHVRTSTSRLRIAAPEHGNRIQYREQRELRTGAYFDTYEFQSQESFRDDGDMAGYAAQWGCAPQKKGGYVVHAIPTKEGLEIQVID